MSAGEWADRRVCVAGLGVSGASVAAALLARGARVLAVDARDRERERKLAVEFRKAGAEVRLGDGETPVDVDLVVTSPGWRPTQPLLTAAIAAGVEVIGEPELAWRLRPEGAAPWLGVTGTNGKTTTVGMLASILTAGGYRAVAAGNVGLPLVDAVLADPPYDVIAVEMSSFQLHWSSSIQFAAAAILNVAPDHLDWHGSLQAYADAKARICSGAVAVYNLDDDISDQLSTGCKRRIGFTLSDPPPGAFGVRDGVLVDGDGTGLLPVEEVHPTGPHNVANALAAAALAHAFGVAPEVVGSGLSTYAPGPHRNAHVAEIDSVSYIDDSKATNPHAAAASLAAYDSVVWIAGGLLKGADVDELVIEHAGRLRAAVVLGQDRDVIRDALARHAPDVPVVEVDATDTGAMYAAVHAAARLAASGDTVLLAPAAASMDIFRDYAERGELFAAAVHTLAENNA
jgi:UDP-N-acetylmuramoylalanine--D-glutamate ligase